MPYREPMRAAKGWRRADWLFARPRVRVESSCALVTCARGDWMIEINTTLRLRDDEVTIQYVRSPGPGGQNVNKVATAAQLRFHIASSSLPPAVRERLARLERTRINRNGVLTLVAHRHRRQEANRREVMARLAELIRRAAHPPRARVATRPTRASREKRLQSKKRRAQVKRTRAPRGASSDEA
jgi:ribosome-associated protein